MTTEDIGPSYTLSVGGVVVVCAITCSCAFVLITVLRQPPAVGSLPIMLTERLHKLLFDRRAALPSHTNIPGNSHAWTLQAVVAAVLLSFAVITTTAVTGFYATNEISLVLTYDLPVVAAVGLVGIWAGIRYGRTEILATILCCICSLVLMLLVETPFAQARLHPLIEGVGLAPILLIDPLDDFLRSRGAHRRVATRRIVGSRFWSLKALVLAAAFYIAYTVAINATLIVGVLVFAHGDVDDAQFSAMVFLIIIVIALLMGFWAAWRYGCDDLRIVWTACLVTAVLPFVLGAGAGHDLAYVLTSVGSWCVASMSASWVGCVLARRLMDTSVRVAAVT